MLFPAAHIQPAYFIVLLVFVISAQSLLLGQVRRVVQPKAFPEIFILELDLPGLGAGELGDTATPLFEKTKVTALTGAKWRQSTTFPLSTQGGPEMVMGMAVGVGVVAQGVSGG